MPQADFPFLGRHAGLAVSHVNAHILVYLCTVWSKLYPCEQHPRAHPSVEVPRGGASGHLGAAAGGPSGLPSGQETVKWEGSCDLPRDAPIRQGQKLTLEPLL